MKGIVEVALESARDTREIIIGRGTISDVGAVFTRHFGTSRPALVADQNTFAAAGWAVEQALRSAGLDVVPPLVFPARPRLDADVRRAMEILEYLPSGDVTLVAVGGGTVNDITKYAAHQVGQPYVVVATAASMDGYASAGAPLARGGFKITIQCTAPRVILADLDVLVNAPPYLSAAGYGDLAGKRIAGADWIVADELGVEPLDSKAWDMIQPHLERWLAGPERLASGDTDIVAGLLEGLTVSGLAMQYAGSSRVASGSEHEIGHLWEMQGVRWQGEHIPHGFGVGLGTILVAAIYEALLDYDFRDLDVEAVVTRWPNASELERAIRAAIGVPAIAERSVEESLTKHPEAPALRARLELLQARWPGIRQRLRAQLRPVAEVRRQLVAAGCPVKPSEFGLSPEDVRKTCAAARYIRRRYTALDLVAEAGVLDEVLDRVFAPGGGWAV
jgi:glycerol-1-phosphate dehydrogenase [NAD(P)+]